MMSLSRLPKNLNASAGLGRLCRMASDVTVQHLVLSGTSETEVYWSSINVAESLTLRGCQHAFNAAFWVQLRDMKATQPLTLYLDQWDDTTKGFAGSWIIPLAWVQRCRGLARRYPFKQIVLRSADGAAKCKAFEDLWATLPVDYTQHAKFVIIPARSISLARKVKKEANC